MILIKELSKMKAGIIENVKTAAQKGDIKTISQWSRAAEQCESLIEEVTNLNSRIQEFRTSLCSERSKGNIASLSTSIVNDNNVSKPRLSVKQEGAKIRSSWVQNIASKGIRLKGHGKSYYTEYGKLVGVAAANELNQPQLISEWFLGLKDEQTDVVVLLCRDLEKKVHDIIIPVAELGEAWEKLSRSKGQMKFHVRRRDGEFLLLVPGNNPIIVSRYIGNYQPLIGVTC